MSQTTCTALQALCRARRPRESLLRSILVDLPTSKHQPAVAHRPSDCRYGNPHFTFCCIVGLCSTTWLSLVEACCLAWRARCSQAPAWHSFSCNKHTMHLVQVLPMHVWHLYLVFCYRCCDIRCRADGHRFGAPSCLICPAIFTRRMYHTLYTTGRSDKSVIGAVLWGTTFPCRHAPPLLPLAARTTPAPSPAAVVRHVHHVGYPHNAP